MQMEKRLLVVDDEAVVRELLMELFQEEGYTVITASNSWMAALRAKDIDCVILDLQLSPKFDMEGGNVLKQLWQDMWCDIPVIVFSGFLGLQGIEDDLKQIERVWGKGRTIYRSISKAQGVKPLISAVNEYFHR
jgi:CheY-like chemotaxis protein